MAKSWVRWSAIAAISIPLSVLSLQREEESLFLRRIADFWQEGEYQIAKTQMEEFIGQYPQSPFAEALSAALGDLFLKEKNYTCALQSYAKLKSEEWVRQTFLHKMRCLYELGWFATLTDECEAYLAKEEDREVLYFLAISLYHQCLNCPKESPLLSSLALKALPFFEKLEQTEFQEETSLAFAHLCALLKDYERATKLYRKAAEGNPNGKEEILFQVGLIESQFDRNLACQTFSEVAQCGGKRAKLASYNELVLRFELGQFLEVVEKGDLSLIPEEMLPSAELLFARSLIELKRYEEAILALNCFLGKKNSSESRLGALLSLLQASYQAENLDALNQGIETLLMEFPDHQEIPKALFTRAQLFKRKERFDLAQQEIQRLLSLYPVFIERPYAMFELCHLYYQQKNWQKCYEECAFFLKTFPSDPLSLYIWRYFASSSMEIALLQKEHQEQLLLDLEKVLALPLREEERQQWNLLLAKTLYELKQYERAENIVSSLQDPNAHLLQAFCDRDGKKDLRSFCKRAEKALKEGADLIEPKSVSICLYNAYLQFGETDKAAEHLFQAFFAKADLCEENLLWLADHYLEQFLEHRENWIFGARSLALFERCPESEEVLAKRGQVLLLLGKIDEAMALLEPLEGAKGRLFLALCYLKKGEDKQALPLLKKVVDSYATLSHPIAAQASLELARLQRFEGKEGEMQASVLLKDLVLQKRCITEPLHLEAALDYVDLLAPLSSGKRSSLLQKMKSEFEKKDDLLSKDYHADRALFPKQDRLYQLYMQFFDAAILLAEANENLKEQKQLQAKAKDILLQIVNEPVISARVRPLLEDGT